MQYDFWLKDNEALLLGQGIITARLDCLVLLEDIVVQDRGWILAHSENSLEDNQLEELNTKIVQRLQHIPLAYIREKAEFYGREFIISRHTLVPRSETETIIEQLKILTTDDSTIIDIGTGSGAIGITAKLELPHTTVIATDIDQQCLDIANRNAIKHKANLTFFKGSLLEPLRKIKLPIASPILLTCNLPYVPDDFQINTAATHEPRHAIFGGLNGLNLYRDMFSQLQTISWQPAYILTESLPPQHETLINIADRAGYHLHVTDDFIQVFKLSES